MPESPVLDRYRLRDRLGAGGMGEVYRAWDSVLDREVALKMVRGDAPPDSPTRARLLREARLAATLSHPNICVVHDVGEAGGQAYVTMELLQGETLRARLARGMIRLDDALRVGRGVAAALAEAHGRGIVHRDIKPENIMILPDGRTKVLDFGLAKPLVPERAAPVAAESAAAAGHGPDVRTGAGGGAPRPRGTTTLPDDGLTSPGAILGTYHYLSPEQADCRPADTRSDVFSFGVVLYEMLSGERPFGGASVQALLEAIRSRRSTPLSERRPDLPGSMIGLVERCLRKDPQERFQHAGDLLAGLDGVARALQRAKVRRRLGGVAALALLPAALTGTWWLTSARPALERESASRGVLPIIRRLTFDGESWEPHYSPDGSLLAFLHMSKDRMVAGVMPAAGGEMRIVAPPSGEFLLIGWMPDGTALTGGWTEDGGKGTWALPLDGGAPRLLVEEGRFADLTSDGARVAYVRGFGAGTRRGLFARDLRSGAETGLYTPAAGSEDCYKPRWAPDDRRIAFHCFDRSTGMTRMYLLEPGGAPVLLEPPDLLLHGLWSWMPDGRHIAISGIRGDRSNVWIVPIPGTDGKPRQLTMGVDPDKQVTVGAGGRVLAFQRETLDADILLLDAGTGLPRQGYAVAPTGEQPVFRGDGGGLFVAESRGGTGTIVSYSLRDGTSKVLGTDPSRHCNRPLALSDGGVLCVCEERTPQGQGGIQEPGHWERTVFRIASAGAAPEALFEVHGAIDLLASSPSGDRVLYRLAKGPFSATLRLFDSATGASTDLLDEPEGHWYAAAAWDGDGILLAHVLESAPAAGGRRVTRLERLDPGTGRVTPLRSVRADLESAALSMDGRRLAYTDHWRDARAPEGGMAVWVLPVRGDAPAHRVALSEHERHPRHLAWSPDGRTLAVERIRTKHDIYTVENPLAGLRIP
jgi:serine/threonine protein kinase